MVGRSLTASRWYATAPKMRIAVMTSVVMMGRRIQIALRFVVLATSGGTSFAGPCDD
jgi:hypothetical protein